MNSLAGIKVGDNTPVRIMGIINSSPESFYKRSVITDEKCIRSTAKSMEEDGADFIDVGGMSTAPYLNTIVSEDVEIRRITKTIESIQKVSRLPISIDTCRSNVAKAALKLGIEIVNDVSGLKFDSNMADMISEYKPSLIVCSYSKNTVKGNQIVQARHLLNDSISIALDSGISKDKIVVDPAIGFFRKKAQGFAFTRINSDWLKRDIMILQNLHKIKNGFPLLVSVSRKSFIGELISKPDPNNRLHGSLVAEMFSIINGANIIRTHNVKATCDIVQITKNFLNIKKGL